MSTVLAAYLSRAYAAKMMKRGDYTALIAEFRAAVAADPDLRIEAAMYLDGLTQKPGDIRDLRDDKTNVIGHAHGDFLEQGLA